MLINVMLIKKTRNSFLFSAKATWQQIKLKHAIVKYIITD